MNQQSNYQRAESAVMPTPQGPIPVALAQLGTSIHEMANTADALGTRLNGVMVPSLPPPPAAHAGGTLAAAPTLASDQANEIHSYRRRVENITAQMNDVLNRLEV